MYNRQVVVGTAGASVVMVVTGDVLASVMLSALLCSVLVEVVDVVVVRLLLARFREVV